MLTRTLSKIILQLENSASTDATQMRLNCVEISKHLIVSTDGYILAKVEHNDPSFHKIDKIYVHRDQLPYMKAMLKLYKNCIEVPSIVNETGIYLDQKLISEKEPVNFPNWQQFVPKYADTVSVGLDADLLMSLVKAIKDGKRDTCKLTFKLNIKEDSKGTFENASIDSTVPVHVYAGKQSSGVIMPVRI